MLTTVHYPHSLVWLVFHMSVKLFCSWQIKYFNNKIICDLVEEAHTGIIALLDEACVGVGNVNDTVFLHALDSRLKKHDHYTSRQVCILCILWCYMRFQFTSSVGVPTI